MRVVERMACAGRGVDVDGIVADLKRMAADVRQLGREADDLPPGDPGVEVAEARVVAAAERFETAALMVLRAGVRDHRVLAVIARYYSDGVDGMRIDVEGLRDGLAARLLVEELAA